MIEYEKNANNFFDNADKDKKSDIYNIIQEPIEEILKGHSFLLTEWWLQKYKKGNYHDLNTHGADPFRRSFILYINCTKDSSNRKFLWPWTSFDLFRSNTSETRTRFINFISIIFAS